MKFIAALTFLLSFNAFGFGCELRTLSTGEILDAQTQTNTSGEMIFGTEATDGRRIIFFPSTGMGYRLEILAFIGETHEVVGHVTRDRVFGSDDYDISLELSEHDRVLICRK